MAMARQTESLMRENVFMSLPFLCSFFAIQRYKNSFENAAL